MAYEQQQLREDIRARQIYYMIYRMGTSDKVPFEPRKLWPLQIDEAPDRGRDVTEDELKRTLALYGGGEIKNTD